MVGEGGEVRGQREGGKERWREVRFGLREDRVGKEREREREREKERKREREIKGERKQLLQCSN